MEFTINVFCHSTFGILVKINVLVKLIFLSTGLSNKGQEELFVKISKAVPSTFNQ